MVEFTQSSCIVIPLNSAYDVFQNDVDYLSAHINGNTSVATIYW